MSSSGESSLPRYVRASCFFWWVECVQWPGIGGGWGYEMSKIGRMGYGVPILKMMAMSRR